MPRWTVGMPSYNNFTEVWFTCQALRMYHGDIDMEIVVVDNYGDLALKAWAEKDGSAFGVRYEKYAEHVGVSPAKNRIFEVATGENVLVIDSHIMLARGALSWDIPDDNLYQGPIIRGNWRSYCAEWLPRWRAGMWGIWGPSIDQVPDAPVEIWAQGAGFFACRRDSWLGFHREFRGFGGETGYLQEKYRKYGRHVYCEPRLQWIHFFNSAKLGGRALTYPMQVLDRVRNYLLGFEELGLDTAPIEQHFGSDAVAEARRTTSADRDLALRQLAARFAAGVAS